MLYLIKYKVIVNFNKVVKIYTNKTKVQMSITWNKQVYTKVNQQIAVKAKQKVFLQNNKAKFTC